VENGGRDLQNGDPGQPAGYCIYAGPVMRV